MGMKVGGEFGTGLRKSGVQGEGYSRTGGLRECRGSGAYWVGECGEGVHVGWGSAGPVGKRVPTAEEGSSWGITITSITITPKEVSRA